MGLRCSSPRASGCPCSTPSASPTGPTTSGSARRAAQGFRHRDWRRARAARGEDSAGRPHGPRRDPAKRRPLPRRPGGHPEGRWSEGRPGRHRCRGSHLRGEMIGQIRPIRRNLYAIRSPRSHHAPILAERPPQAAERIVGPCPRRGRPRRRPGLRVRRHRSPWAAPDAVVFPATAEEAAAVVRAAAQAGVPCTAARLRHELLGRQRRRTRRTHRRLLADEPDSRDSARAPHGRRPAWA